MCRMNPNNMHVTSGVCQVRHDTYKYISTRHAETYRGMRHSNSRCVMTFSYICMWMNESHQTKWVMWHMNRVTYEMGHVTYEWVMSHMNVTSGLYQVRRDTCEYISMRHTETYRGMRHTDAYMGWLRSVGSIKLYVSFAECCLFYRALLQNRLIILRSLLI